MTIAVSLNLILLTNYYSCLCTQVDLFIIVLGKDAQTPLNGIWCMYNSNSPRYTHIHTLSMSYSGHLSNIIESMTHLPTESVAVSGIVPSLVINNEGFILAWQV